MTLFGELLMVAGAAWSLLAAIGINRFDDIYSRMHAATKSTTLGLVLVLIGAALHLPGPEALKLLLAALLLFLTAPIGAHLVGRSVHRNRGVADVRIDTIDELRAAEDAEDEDPGSPRP